MCSTHSCQIKSTSHVNLHHLIEFVGESKVLLQRLIVVLELHWVGHSHKLRQDVRVSEEGKVDFSSDIDQPELVTSGTRLEVGL